MTLRLQRGQSRALLQGDEVSPLKKGRKVRIPYELTYALATHSMMMQVAGDGEASGANTEHEGKALTSKRRWLILVCISFYLCPTALSAKQNWTSCSVIFNLNASIAHTHRWAKDQGPT